MGVGQEMFFTKEKGAKPPKNQIKLGTRILPHRPFRFPFRIQTLPNFGKEYWGIMRMVLGESRIRNYALSNLGYRRNTGQ